MKRREFLTKLGALGMMGLAPAFAGCIGDSTDTIASPSTTATAAPTIISAASSTITTSYSLARTCPKGKRCTRPDCGLWSDLNGDNKCDRGYF